MNSQAHAILSLAPGEARRLGLGDGELTVLRGRVWLTGECGDADQILSPGQSLRVGDAQAVVIEAWDRGAGASLRWQARRPLLQGLPLRGWAGAFFAALARSAASSASRAQGCIKAGDSIASSGAVK